MLAVTSAWAGETFTYTLNGKAESSPSGFFSYDTSGKFNFNTKYNGCTYDGVEYTSGLKMEGTTKILFTTTEAATVTIVQSNWSDKTVMFDGTEYSDRTAGTGCYVYTIKDVAAGEHNITRGSGEAGLFLVKVQYADKPKTVSFTNDANWQKVYVWAWKGNPDASDYENFTGGTWPGVELTETEGTYSWETMGDPTNIIFSDGGQNQTADLQFKDGGVYNSTGRVINLNDYSATFSTDGMDEVYAYVWNGEEKVLGEWPGTKMEGGNGKFSIDFKAEDAPKYIIFHDNLGNQTPDWAFEDGKAYEYMLQDFSVSFTTDADWTDTYVYMWTGDKVYTDAWPGTKMVGEAYEFKAFVAPESIQFNNGEAKTGDLKFVNNKAYQWITAEPLYKLNKDESFAAGTTVNVTDADKEVVATITYGSSGNDFTAAIESTVDSWAKYGAMTAGNGTNGDQDGGTFYTIVPKYDGTISVAVRLNGGKKFYVMEDGTALAGYDGITIADAENTTFSFAVSANKSYKFYCAGSKLGFFGFDYKFKKPEPQLSTFTATFTTNLDWKVAYAYAWSGEGETATKFLGNWPGTPLDPSNNPGEYLLSFQAEAAPDSIIFNDGTTDNPQVGTNKTAELEFVNEKAYSYQLYNVHLADNMVNGTVEPNKYKAAAGEQVLLKVTPNDNYDIDQVNVANATGAPIDIQPIVGGDYHYSFVMPGEDVYVSATFKEAAADSYYYQKVTSTTDITDGKYLIVYEDGAVAFNGALTTLDAVSNTVAVEIKDGIIASSDATDAAAFTIDVTNGTLQSASGFYIGVTSNSNALKQSEIADSYKHSFAIDDDGNAVIKAEFEESTMTLRFNKASNQTRFRYYKNGQEAIALYKLTEGSGGGEEPQPQPVDIKTLAINGEFPGMSWDPAEGIAMQPEATAAGLWTLELKNVTVEGKQYDYKAFADGKTDGYQLPAQGNNNWVFGTDEYPAGTYDLLFTANTSTNELTLAPTYVGPNTIAQLNALKANTEFSFTGNAIVVAKAVRGGEYDATTNNVTWVYIKDETGNSLIYDSENGKKATQIERGNVITAPWTGTVNIYKNLFEVVPSTTLLSTSTVLVEIPEGSIADLSADSVNKVVEMKGLTIKSVNEKNIEFALGDDAVAGYNQFQTPLPEETEGKTFNVVGAIGRYNDNIQFWPISFTEVKKQQFSVGFTTDKEWKQVYAYTWKGDVVPNNWPGEEITSTLKEGVYTYAFEAAEAPDFIIFNDGTKDGSVVGTNQTTDLTFVDGTLYTLTTEKTTAWAGDPEEAIPAETGITISAKTCVEAGVQEDKVVRIVAKELAAAAPARGLDNTVTGDPDDIPFSIVKIDGETVLIADKDITVAEDLGEKGKAYEFSASADVAQEITDKGFIIKPKTDKNVAVAAIEVEKAKAPEPAVDIEISPESGDIAAALATAVEGKNVGKIQINLTAGGEYTVGSAMVAPGAFTIRGNGATVNVAADFTGEAIVKMAASAEAPTAVTKVDYISFHDVTFKGLSKPLFYSTQKKYDITWFTIENSVLELTADAITIDFTKGSAARNINVVNSTIYAAAATTKSFYSSQAGEKMTEIDADGIQTFIFKNNTMYNLAKAKNFFTHRQNNQKWLAYDVENNIFVNCGKSGQVIKGMNGGQGGSNPTWTIIGNAFNFDGADTSANEETGDTDHTGDETPGLNETVQNSVAGEITFTDAANGDFNGVCQLIEEGATKPETLGAQAWTITYKMVPVPSGTYYVMSANYGTVINYEGKLDSKGTPITVAYNKETKTYSFTGVSETIDAYAFTVKEAVEGMSGFYTISTTVGGNEVYLTANEDGTITMGSDPSAEAAIWIILQQAYWEDIVNSTYTVAGTKNLTGTENDWDIAEANQMTLNDKTGLFEKKFKKIAVNAENQPEFKVVKKAMDETTTWYPTADNWKITTEYVGGEGLYDITITFDPSDLKEIGVIADKRVVFPDDALVYDFETEQELIAAGTVAKPGNKNGSAANGQAFWAWEKSDKTDSKRQDYKGYAKAEGSQLPDVCNVWRRSDRFDQDASWMNEGGVTMPNNREMAIDGLEAGDKVIIVYDAENATDKDIIWAIGDGTSEGGPGVARATATINGVEAVTGETTIASGAEIVVNSVTPADNGTGYIVFQVKKGMVIKQIAIVKAPTPKFYIIGDMNSWDRTAMTEMTFNAETQAYEYEYAPTTTAYFAFADKQLTADEAAADEEWAIFNATNRYAIGENNVEATLNEAVALQKVNGTIVLKTVKEGTSYKISVAKDLSTVTITGEAAPEPEPTYTVAGAFHVGEDDLTSFFGTAWDPTAAANDMEKQEDGTYKKVYENVSFTEIGQIQFKIVENHSWDVNYGWDGYNAFFDVTTPATNVTVTFTFDPNGATDQDKVKIDVKSASTAINGIDAEDADDNTPIYNLAGQKVTKSYKGVVIKNGKKYLVK